MINAAGNVQAPTTVPIPAPVTGWNARDPLSGMAQTDAIRLENYIPWFGSVILRPGYISHATGLGGSVQSLMEWRDTDGTTKLIGAANANLWDATSAGAASSLASGLSNNKWQSTQFGSTLIMVNGADTPRKYDSGGLATATYTGTGLTATTLVNVSAYKRRLYFCEIDSANVWYSDNVDSVTGGLTKFDASYVLQRGGAVQFAGSWTSDKGNTLQDYFVVASDQGEVLVYSGSYPGDSAWTLVSRHFIGRTLGRRAFVNVGADLAIITEMGVVPMRMLLSPIDSIGTIVDVTDKIQNAFRDAGKKYGDEFGWGAEVYPKLNLAILNIPISGDTTYEQYVMNLRTGAWCKFCGINAVTWRLSNNDMYFGDTSGTVYKFDSGNDDNGNFIDGSIKQAFIYPNSDRYSIKRVTLAKPLITGETSVEFEINVDYDFEESAVSGGTTVEVTGSEGEDWDSADWDVDSWGNVTAYRGEWSSVASPKLGRAVSLKMDGRFKAAPHEIASTQIIYESGGAF